MEPSETPAVKYKGVRKRKWGKWVSEIRLPNSRERIWLGSYNTAEKAARAFDVAQFCLRGPSAQFNFPDDPPDVPGWQTFTPAEIQDVAAQYGSDYSRPPPANATVRQGNDETITHVMELDDTSPSSTSEGDMYVPPQPPPPPPPPPPPSSTNDHDSDSYEGHFSQSSFLWNF